MEPATSSLEQQVLLAALRCRSVAGDGTVLPAALGQMNWQKFLAITSRDLYPYLCSRLEPYLEGFQGRPVEFEELRTARRLTAVDNLRFRHELSRIVDSLTEANIPVLALKGIVLAYTAYRDPSLRPMADLDLLVPQGERENAIVVLRKLGFDYPQATQALLRDHNWRLAPEQEYAPPMRSSGSKVRVEVHTELDCSEPLFQVRLQELWSRSTTTVLGGLTVRTLCAEDNLFHICMHQARAHRFEKGLLPLLDIRVLLDSHQGWDWPGIAARSLQRRCDTWMYLSLEAARNFAGAAVPDSFFHALPEPRDLSKLRPLVEEQILSARAEVLVAPFLSLLLAENSWWRRAQMLFIRMSLLEPEERRRQDNSGSFLKLAQVFCQRLMATMKTRIPRYLEAWQSGRLRLRTIYRSAYLYRNSDVLFELVERKNGPAENAGLVRRPTFGKAPDAR